MRVSYASVRQKQLFLLKSGSPPGRGADPERHKPAAGSPPSRDVRRWTVARLCSGRDQKRSSPECAQGTRPGASRHLRRRRAALCCPAARGSSFRQQPTAAGQDRRGETDRLCALKLVILSSGHKQLQRVSGLRQHTFASLCPGRAVGLLGSGPPTTTTCLFLPDRG